MAITGDGADKTLFAAAKPACFAELAAAGIVVAVLWGAVSPAALAAWSALLAAVALARLVLHWKRRFVLGALASGALWSLAVLMFFPHADPLRQMALLLVAGGHLIAAAGIYGASRKVFYAFSILPFLAILTQLLAQPGGTYRLMALALAIFGIVMWKVHLGPHRNILANLNAQSLVLETLPVGVAFVENDSLVRCNRRLEEMLGYGPGELGKAATREWFESGAAWPNGSGIMEGDTQVRRKDGSRLWCRVLARALERGSFIYTFAESSEAMYRILVETSSELIWSVDAEGRWSYLNAAGARRIYGRDPAEMVGRAQSEVVARELKERDDTVMQRILGGEAVFEHETRHLRADGVAVDLSFNAIPLRDLKGRVIGATGTARDVTERIRASAALHESVEKLRLAVQAADLRYWEWDAERDGPGLPDAAGGDLVYAEDRERCASAWNDAIARGEPYEVEYRISSADAEPLWFSSRGVPVVDAAGRAYRMIGVSQDITGRKRREDAVRFLAYHDSLTGLPNRRLLDDRLKQALYSAQRRSRKVAAMLIDLDDFKRVNDSLGHRAGDAVLREVAQRLAGCVRKADTLARHGGDEFVVVLSDVQAEADCRVVADKLLRALENDFRVEGQAFRLGASIGISLFPGEASDGDALLRNADAAMYRAKQLGRNRYSFYGR